VGTDPEYDRYFCRPNLHALHQEADEVAPREPVCVRQPRLHLPGKLRQPVHDRTKLLLQRSCFRCHGRLLFKLRQALSQPSEPRRKLAFLDQSLGIAVNQAGNPLLELGHLGRV
jgi:hypothetical protein